MTAPEFVAKWQKVELTERAAAQQHFLDLCALLGHGTPAALDPTGDSFTFERGAEKTGGGDGWADVWKKGFFGWEYKGRHKNLDDAYAQLKLYAESLENPPLLVVCDLDRIVIRTNFTNTATEVHTVHLAALGEARSLHLLRAVFFSPDKLKPGLTSQLVTERAAMQIAQIAAGLRERGLEPREVARFLDRIVFCLFAEDVGLLPANLVRRVVEAARTDPPRLRTRLEQLFGVMATGGDYGADVIQHFNGGLFSEATALELTRDDIEAVLEAAKLDWASVDPTIFGTLFERGLDPGKRAQLGAHYTSREDIECLIEPVVMAPLRREWAATRAIIESLLETGRKQRPAEPVARPTGGQLTKARNEAQTFIRQALYRLAEVRVLDPACGSGNFLYVTLQKLKDLEKEIIVFALDHGFTALLPMVGPWQLRGIEINQYAAELAQMVIWIGHLQWIQRNGLGTWGSPILEGTGTVECRDAILDLSTGEPREAEWPAAEFIVGNPPFLGTKKLRGELGDHYVERLFAVYGDRIPPFSDICCYWFEKARAAIEIGRTRRAGLLATQGIRGGLNRRVLERIKKSGDIFFAESDRNWVLEGASVHVSMVGFDRGAEQDRLLDGERVTRINPDLTARTDVTRARRLSEAQQRGFVGDVKSGPFDLTFGRAKELLVEPTPHGRPTSGVLTPWVNGLDLLRRLRHVWIIDFPSAMAAGEAAQYGGAFEHVNRFVRPDRLKVKRRRYRELWWIHAEPCDAMRAALRRQSRYLATPTVSKHRIFTWLRLPVLPDHQLVAFAFDQDWQLGVLHSRVHEVWARALGTQVRERESGFRYTPTSCFETFPFPELTETSRATIAAAAKSLDELRTRWLNPPEWVVEDVFEFPASVDGPWGHLVVEPNAEGIGRARYVRLLPTDEEVEKKLKKRTLTNLYNERPAWLDNAHRALDEAVFAAYGWSPNVSDDDLLSKLLELNLSRAAVDSGSLDDGSEPDDEGSDD